MDERIKRRGGLLVADIFLHHYPGIYTFYWWAQAFSQNEWAQTATPTQAQKHESAKQFNNPYEVPEHFNIDLYKLSTALAWYFN